jgi:hypothetical protein
VCHGTGLLSICLLCCDIDTADPSLAFCIMLGGDGDDALELVVLRMLVALT